MEVVKVSEGEVFLSAVMIVKNEERHLERCLSSIVNIVDEIVIVDTGSTDKSIKIAESFGARIFHHPWENDFSLHRNQSLKYARGKWVFVIDADEEVILKPETEKNTLKKWLKNKIPKDYDAVALLLKDVQKNIDIMTMNTARIFRKGKVRYEGIVHNKPMLVNNKHGERSIFCSYFHLNHYGYDLTPEQKKVKRQRTEGLLFARLKKDPKDYECYFYLAQIYAEAGEKKEAASAGEKYLENKNSPNMKAFNESIYFTLVHIYMKMGNMDRVKYWLNEGLKIIPDDLDLNLSLVEYGVWSKRIEIIQIAATKFHAIYQHQRNNPAFGGRRFQYASSEEAHAYCMFHLCRTQIQLGMKVLGELYTKILPNTPDEFRNGMTKDLEAQLKNVGFHPQFIKKEDTVSSIGVRQKRKLNFGGVV